MMRVGFDGTVFGLQRVGGVSNYAWEMLRRFAAMADVQTVLSLPVRVVSDRAPSIAELKVEKRRQFLPLAIALRLPIRLVGDVVFSPYYRVPVTPRSRYVITLHDLIHERYRTGLPRMVHSFLKRQACLRAHVIICVSNNTRADLLSTYPEIDPERALVIPHGVDHQTFLGRDTARSDLHDAVLFVGQRRGYKRFDLAVAAVALTNKRLAVVGEPPDQDDQKLLDTQLQNRWVALGRVSPRELSDLYAGSFAFIYPSDYEGFGLPILEAQASGCPVVAANRSSCPEVGGQGALYAESQTAEAYAARLRELENPTKRERHVAQGLANAAKYDWDKTFDLTMNAFRRAMTA